jgi:hypothetical protein
MKFNEIFIYAIGAASRTVRVLARINMMNLGTCVSGFRDMFARLSSWPGSNLWDLYTPVPWPLPTTVAELVSLNESLIARRFLYLRSYKWNLTLRIKYKVEDQRKGGTRGEDKEIVTHTSSLLFAFNLKLGYYMLKV